MSQHAEGSLFDQTKCSSKTSVHFSSKTGVWATPGDLFAELQEEFKFSLDVCALAENAKCERYLTPEDDGLKQPWEGVCWMNPPYGRDIHHWVRKAFEASREGALVVALLPARTDTAWWHDFVVAAAEVRFIRGRLKFGNGDAPAPFPSVIAVFWPPRTSGTRWMLGFYRKGKPQARKE